MDKRGLNEPFIDLSKQLTSCLTQSSLNYTSGKRPLLGLGWLNLHHLKAKMVCTYSEIQPLFKNKKFKIVTWTKLISSEPRWSLRQMVNAKRQTIGHYCALLPEHACSLLFIFMIATSLGHYFLLSCRILWLTSWVGNRPKVSLAWTTRSSKTMYCAPFSKAETNQYM